jgi:hypothetical protein
VIVAAYVVSSKVSSNLSCPLEENPNIVMHCCVFLAMITLGAIAAFIGYASRKQPKLLPLKRPGFVDLAVAKTQFGSPIYIYPSLRVCMTFPDSIGGR